MDYSIPAGVALILFGVRFLRKGLDRLFGIRLSGWLSAMTSSRIKAFLGGALVGAVAPSSTGVSMIALQLLEAGKLGARRILAVVLGANVGITMMAQLMALRLQESAGLLLLAGVIGFLYFKRTVLRGVGQCLLALGFVFVAMDYISKGAKNFAAHPDVSVIIGLLEGHLWFVLFATALLAVVMQSSTATIGLGLALASAGVLNSSLLAVWVLGTNLGVGATALILGWPTIEGRRLGLSVLLIKCLVALPLVLLPELMRLLFDFMPGPQMERQLAMFHTFFNLIAGVTGLFLSGPLSRLTALAIVPANNQELPRATSYLDERVLDTPSIALAQATRETLAMGDEARLMLEQFWRAYQKSDPELAKLVRREDDRIDQLNRNLCHYLTCISGEKTEQETQWQMILHTFSNELESIGDIVDKHLCGMILKHPSRDCELPEPERSVIEQLHKTVLSRLDRALGLLTTRGSTEAKEFLAGKEQLNNWCRDQQREHYSRLRAGNTDLQRVSPFFLDMLNSYRRINSHLTTLAYGLLKNGKRARGSMRTHPLRASQPKGSTDESHQGSGESECR